MEIKNYNFTLSLGGLNLKPQYDGWSHRKKTVQLYADPLRSQRAVNIFLPGDENFLINQVIPLIRHPFRRLLTVALQTAVTQGEEATQVWLKSLQDFAIYKKYRAIEAEIDQRDRMNRLNPLFVEKFKSSSFFNQAFEYTAEIKNDITFGRELVPGDKVMTFSLMAQNRQPVPLEKYLEKGKQATEALENVFKCRNITWARVSSHLQGNDETIKIFQ